VPLSIVPPYTRPAFSLVEVLTVCAIVGIVTAIAIPRFTSALDWIAVEAAAREVENALALGRRAGMRHAGAEVRIDTSQVIVKAAGRVLDTRFVSRDHGIRIKTNTAVVRFASTGLATGLSNGSIILARGSAVETVFVSRLGRVRR